MNEPNSANKGLNPQQWFLKIALIFLVVITAGSLFWLFFYSTDSPIGAGWFLFSFAAGLSMIVLPCTLPLAFVIVPLSVNKGAAKGLGIALAFGIGVVITLSFYGILAAFLGEVAIGSLGAPLETVKNWLYFIAGIFAFLFALGELGLIKFRMPSYTGAAPAFIQKQSDYLKALLLGLFLGNVGVGCPHPATPFILTRIAVSGDIFYGWLLFLVHAIGRVIPLFILVILALLGVNSLVWLIKNKEKVEKISGWMMVFVAGFILTLGLFTHDWWVYSGQHNLFEIITAETFWTNILAGRIGVNPPHIHGLPTGTGILGLPFWLGSWLMVALWIIPLFWYWSQEKRKLTQITEENTRVCRRNYLRLLFWFFTTLAFTLAVMFGYALPEWFVNHKSKEIDGHAAAVNAKTTKKIKADFRFDGELKSGIEKTLTFALKDENGNPLTNLETGHDRILHIIIISEDLKIFSHIHPEDFNVITLEEIAKSEFKIKYNFPKAMRYLMAIDFQHQSHEISQQFSLEASGPKKPILIEKDLSLKKKINDYEIALTLKPEKAIAGKEINLFYHIEKNSRPSKDLEYYLDAPMHLSIISAELANFIHTHGKVPAAPLSPSSIIKKAEAHDAPLAGFGPDIEARVIFPYPGIYKIFGEFRHQNKIIVSEFMIEASANPNQKEIVDQPAHSH